MNHIHQNVVKGTMVTVRAEWAESVTIFKFHISIYFQGKNIPDFFKIHFPNRFSLFYFYYGLAVLICVFFKCLLHLVAAVKMLSNRKFAQKICNMLYKLKLLFLLFCVSGRLTHRVKLRRRQQQLRRPRKRVASRGSLPSSSPLLSSTQEMVGKHTCTD